MTPKRFFRRALAIVFSAVALAYVGIMAYRFFSTPIRTETAREYSVYDSITTQGIMLRDEIVVSSTTPGVVYYYFDDGEKVSKLDIVAEVFLNRAEADSMALSKSLDQEIEMLIESQDPSATQREQIEQLSKEQFLKLVEMTTSAGRGRVADVETLKLELNRHINRCRIATGKEINYTRRISLLEEQKKLISSSLPQRMDTITAPNTGYFVSTADGFEEVAAADAVKEYTFSDYFALLNSRPDRYKAPADAVGKVITSFDWYFAVLVDADHTGKLPVGKKVDLSFASKDYLVQATVKKVLADQASGREIVILTSDYMDSVLATSRIEDVTLQFDRQRGIRVSSKAIRFDENQVRGVYILKDGVVLFRPVELIYEGSGYFLVQSPEDEKTPLRQFDEVIVEGKEVYHGRIIG